MSLRGSIRQISRRRRRGGPSHPRRRRGRGRRHSGEIEVNSAVRDSTESKQQSNPFSARELWCKMDRCYIVISGQSRTSGNQSAHSPWRCDWDGSIPPPLCVPFGTAAEYVHNDLTYRADIRKDEGHCVERTEGNTARAACLPILPIFQVSHTPSRTVCPAICLGQPAASQ